MTSKEQILSAIRSNKEKISGLGIKDIGLFGSYVRDEPTQASDIDLLIDFEPEKETFDDFILDETLKHAVVRSLEIIGEATKKIPADLHPFHKSKNSNRFTLQTLLPP